MAKSMGLDLLELDVNTAINNLDGIKIELAGKSDVGKTTIASQMEKPLLLCCEAGSAAINKPKVFISDFDVFTSYVQQLTSKYTQMKEKFQTIIIDSVDALNELGYKKIANRFGVLDVGMIQGLDKNNPNGYTLARTLVRQQLSALEATGYTLVFITHVEENKDYVNPMTGKVSPVKMIPVGTSNPKSTETWVQQMCDFVIYVQGNGVDEQGRKICSSGVCRETDKIFARTRFSTMPTIIPELTGETLTKEILEAIKKNAKNEGLEIVRYSQSDNKLRKEDYFTQILPYMQKVFELDPQYIADLLAKNIGEGKKLTEATDNQLIELSNIYNELINYCMSRDIVI